MKNKAILNLVIPCYNEEEALPYTKKELDKKMKALIDDGLISKESKVVLVNDGSKDKTWDIITEFHTKDNMYVGINLSSSSFFR